jgi:hypothetical protein
MTPHDPLSAGRYLEAVARQLHLPNPLAAAQGGLFELDDVPVQMEFMAHRSALRLSLEIGDPTADHAADVHAHWLALQHVLSTRLDAWFALDTLNNRHLFILQVPLVQESDARSTALTVKRAVAQVREWRDTVMQGRLIDYEQFLMRQLGEQPHEDLL